MQIHFSLQLIYQISAVPDRVLSASVSSRHHDAIYILLFTSDNG